MINSQFYCEFITSVRFSELSQCFVLSLGLWPSLYNDLARRSQTVFTFSPSKLLFNHVLEVSPIAVVTPVLPVTIEGAQFPEIHGELSAGRKVCVTQTYTRANADTVAACKRNVRRIQTTIPLQSDPDCVLEGGVSRGVINLASIIGSKVYKRQTSLAVLHPTAEHIKGAKFVSL